MFYFISLFHFYYHVGVMLYPKTCYVTMLHQVSFDAAAWYYPLIFLWCCSVVLSSNFHSTIWTRSSLGGPKGWGCFCRPRGAPTVVPPPAIPAPDPIPAGPTSSPAAPPRIVPQRLAVGWWPALASWISVWCCVVVCGIGDSLVLGVFLGWFCVGIRVVLVICLWGVVLGVFLCSVGVLVRCCLFLVVFCSVLCCEELFACSLRQSVCVFVRCWLLWFLVL